jgi:hypothetical protein
VCGAGEPETCGLLATTLSHYALLLVWAAVWRPAAIIALCVAAGGIWTASALCVAAGGVWTV